MAQDFANDGVEEYAIDRRRTSARVQSTHGGQARRSGDRGTMRVTEPSVRIRDGMVVRFVALRDRDRALKAVGLEE